jgi:Fur family transcriptional regulator, peroxide stress response regulator
MGKDSAKQDKRLTPQREAVLQAVREVDDHPTANDLFARARKYLPGISYATVYNSLRYLREAGLVQELRFGDSASRYDAITERHDHALCSECGKLVDFDLAGSAELMNEAARKSHFQPESVHLTLVGRCPDCLEVKNKDS